jgi:hypothetical protein
MDKLPFAAKKASLWFILGALGLCYWHKSTLKKDQD